MIKVFVLNLKACQKMALAKHFNKQIHSTVKQLYMQIHDIHIAFSHFYLFLNEVFSSEVAEMDKSGDVSNPGMFC